MFAVTALAGMVGIGTAPTGTGLCVAVEAETDDLTSAATGSLGAAGCAVVVAEAK